VKRRFIQQPNGELLEVSLDYQSEPRNTDAYLWNDREYQDMNDPRFNSRSTHREYMKRNNLTTIDDFREHDARQRRAREDFYRGIDQSRRDDIARALEQQRGR